MVAAAKQADEKAKPEPTGDRPAPAKAEIQDTRGTRASAQKTAIPKPSGTGMPAFAASTRATSQPSAT